MNAHDSLSIVQKKKAIDFYEEAESIAKEWDNFHSALKNAAELFPHESFHGRNHYVKPEGADQARDAGCHLNALISRMIDIAMSVRISVNQQTSNQ